MAALQNFALKHHSPFVTDAIVDQFANKHVFHGLLWFSGGCAFSALTYAASATSGGGVYFVATGAIVVGALQFLYGLLVAAGNTLSRANLKLPSRAHHQPAPVAEPELASTITNEARWRALTEYDQEIREAAQQLYPFGQRWVDEMGRVFFALSEDRRYISAIAQRLTEEAVRQAEEVERKNHLTKVQRFLRTRDGQVCTSESLNILIGAADRGYSLEVEEDGTFVAKKGQSATYLRSNNDIRRFGTFM